MDAKINKQREKWVATKNILIEGFVLGELHG
jgi:hypothetical protein